MADTNEYDHTELDFSTLDRGDDWFLKHRDEFVPTLHTLLKRIDPNGTEFNPETLNASGGSIDSLGADEGSITEAQTGSDPHVAARDFSMADPVPKSDSGLSSRANQPRLGLRPRDSFVVNPGGTMSISSTTYEFLYVQRMPQSVYSSQGYGRTYLTFAGKASPAAGESITFRVRTTSGSQSVEHTITTERDFLTPWVEFAPDDPSETSSGLANLDVEAQVSGGTGELLIGGTVYVFEEV